MLNHHCYASCTSNLAVPAATKFKANNSLSMIVILKEEKYMSLISNITLINWQNFHLIISSLMC